MKRTCFGITALMVAGVLGTGCGDTAQIIDSGTEDSDWSAQKGDWSDSIDVRLRTLLFEYEVTEVDNAQVLPMDDPKVVLGQMLFFDKALSGGGDVSCATCHHPSLGTSDGLALPVGVGGHGFGPARELGPDRGFIPRNSPDIWNRGATEWTTMFWDSRVHQKPGYFGSPAGLELPEGLDSVLAVQAMFPPTSPEEMRGHPGENAIADLEDLPEIWKALTERILAYDDYPPLFEQAYPDVPLSEIGFQHIANAIAAYEVAAFTRLDSPFDRYVAGDNTALNEQQKRGAELFFGAASCGNCHNGSLLTDQKTHVIAVPQFGPGKGDEAPADPGRFLETGDDSDRFAFRTPPLRNVELTAPYTHSGAYATLSDVVRHHLDPLGMGVNYRASDHVSEAVAETWLTDEVTTAECQERISEQLMAPHPISEQDIEDLVVFLLALTDPSSYDMSSVIPDAVPSGLPMSEMTAPTDD